MTYFAAFIFALVAAGGLTWFVCKCLEGAFDLEDMQ